MTVRPPSKSDTDSAPFFEMVPDAFLVTDLAGMVVALNAGASALLERRLSDSVVIDELFTPVDRPNVRFALRSLVEATPEECDLQVTLDRAREPVPVWVRASRAVWGWPPETAVVWTLRAFGAMEEPHVRLQGSDALQEAHLLALVHDLRSPVSVLRSAVEILGGTSPTEQTLATVAQALRGAVREVEGILTDVERADPTR